MKLFKNKQDGMMFGVCAGISQSTGLDVSLLRIAAIIGSLMTGSALFWIYLLLAIILPNKE